ncbi:MAG TPA: hypothetical protein VLZ30_09725 [Verrucomicrobiae bacterium]|nr:hypothetical protein [Verrucomicrobiae bacterium]
MKTHTPAEIWAHRAWPDHDVVIHESHPVTRDGTAAWAEPEFVARQEAGSGSLSTPMRIVGILAFCQAIGFLALFLFLCARAGAATGSNTVSHLALTKSMYETQTQRDPFGAEVSKTLDATGAGSTRTAGADAFKLMGILYSAASPSALVNGELVELNKPVRMQTTRGEVEVKAVTITRDLVVMEVGGQKVELRLGGTEGDKGSK